MTSAELRAWRASYTVRGRRHKPGPAPAGLSQTAAAARLGVYLRTYQAWESGERPVPHWVARLIA